MLLDWPKCFHIINGIVQGLLYLYQDSRLRIIHRDMKGSNILLDHEMNPKISDFGLARIFGRNETKGNLKKVVGTYVWRLYKASKTVELIDASIQNSCILPEVLRSIHVGLLCVQQQPEYRPNMASVILMLGRDGGALTHRKQPGFFTERNLIETESSGSGIEQCSANMVSITLLEAR
ncbi:unnamed protein product [Camellia sinensis]